MHAGGVVFVLVFWGRGLLLWFSGTVALEKQHLQRARGLGLVYTVKVTTVATVLFIEASLF